jgi:hypothetical protein
MICDYCVCGGEVLHNFWKCSGCASFYYSSYYDCWDREEPDDLWYEISESDFTAATQRIASCPEPTRKYCDCPLHPFTLDLANARKLGKN